MRFVGLDSWRGIAAVTIVIYHYALYVAFFSSDLILNSYLFVDFFFVLSGFVISNAYADRLVSFSDARSFIIRRFGRLWPLHMATLIALIGMEFLRVLIAFVRGTSTSAFYNESLSTLFGQVFFLQGFGFYDDLAWNVPSWSIASEFWMYVVFATACIVAGGRRGVVLAVLGISAWIYLVLFSTEGMDATEHLGFLRCVVGFSMGYFIFRVRQEGKLDWIARSPLIEPVLVVFLVIFIWLGGQSEAAFLSPLIFAGVVFVFSFGAGGISRILKARPLQLIGEWSFSIYMVHWVVLMGFVLVLRQVQRIPGMFRLVDSSTGFSLHGIDQYALTCLFAIFFVGTVILTASQTYKFVEVPARRYFNRLSERSPLPRSAEAST